MNARRSILRKSNPPRDGLSASEGAPGEDRRANKRFSRLAALNRMALLSTSKRQRLALAGVAISAAVVGPTGADATGGAGVVWRAHV